MARWQSWSIASDLKSDESLRIPWVRIPLSPLLKLFKFLLYNLYLEIKISSTVFHFLIF